MSDPTERDEGYDDFLDAVAAGEGYYLECPQGHGSLPPRRACPTCGATDLTERPLPDSGAVETFTVVSVPTPRFSEDAPYATAIADFGPVRLTGVIRDPDDAAVGLTVVPDVGETETSGERLLLLRPA